MPDQNKVPGASEEPQFDRKQLIKLVVELGPLIVFFIVNSRFGIFAGTGAFMVATVIALGASRALLGRIATMPLVTGVFVLVFGGLTLWLQDDHFIKIKPTIVNGLFAAILIAGLISGRLFLKIVFGDVMRLSEEGWRILTLRWALFFVFLSILNEVMWRFFSTDTWVAFKVFGIMPITFVFALAQIGLLKKYEPAPSDGPNAS
ncbi:septation protein A [Hyphomicrobium sp.]|uniref:septation protein A n=1 Tax=Hyphomicrobium sp. TaxID=82 RepID=UPI000FC00422|nr:septation protein A [Hyphomicrobium sp.]RUP08375.1 MAG: septation protein A [Hyphomicrobium sp.]